MSENEERKLELSEVVSKIMEHPELIEEIGGLLSKEGEKPAKKEESAEKTPAFSPLGAQSEAKRRGQLLGALRPYLSSDRKKLLDSMSAVLELLETMGRSV